MEPGDLMDRLEVLCRSLGIRDIGCASAQSWASDPLVSARIPEGGGPADIMPGARSVVVIGIPVQPTVLATAPSIWYNHLYGVVNTMLDQAAERIALELLSLGYRAVAVPRDGYHGLEGLRADPSAFFSHRHAAYLAGMGSFGWNNMLLTERYGPRIRLTSVITDAELPCGEPVGDDLCVKCGRCVRECPGRALSDAGYPEGVTVKPSCVEVSAGLRSKGISPCGRCIAVCPVGQDAGGTPSDAAVARIRSYVKPERR